MVISDVDAKILWGRSGGVCSNPNCRVDLTVLLEDSNYHIGEMAHIIAKQPLGNRGVSTGGSNEYGNLILLCPTCHRRIDKSPDGHFSVETLHEWKKQAEELMRNQIRQNNDCLTLFKYVKNIIYARKYAHLFNINSLAFYSTSAAHKITQWLEESRAKAFFLKTPSDRSVELLSLVQENYTNPDVQWSVIISQLDEIIQLLPNDFCTARDRNVINTTICFVELLTTKALELDSSVREVNFHCSIEKLAGKSDSTMKEIISATPKNIDALLEERLIYILRSL